MRLLSQPCFHPLYRMRAKADSSALNNCTVAIWVTKYENVVPEVSSGIARARAELSFRVSAVVFQAELRGQHRERRIRRVGYQKAAVAGRAIERRASIGDERKVQGLEIEADTMTERTLKTALLSVLSSPEEPVSRAARTIR